MIDTHLLKCEIAGGDAHNYLSPDRNDRPISVNRIDPGNAEEGSIGNLGSYIGAYGKELFERGLDELKFRAAAWTTGTQIAHFSTGTNEMIAHDRGDNGVGEVLEGRVVPNPEFDPELHRNANSDVQPFEVENPSWSIVGIARGKGEDEEIFELRESNVIWR